MKRSQLALLMMFGGAGMAIVATSGCSSDSSDEVGASGKAGSAGHAGHAVGESGAAGSAEAGDGSGGTATGGRSGVAGSNPVAGGGGLSSSAGAAGASGGEGGAYAGEGGVAGSGEAGSAGQSPTTPCGPTNPTTPTVPTDIQLNTSAVLVAAYAAEGTQTYTCQVTGSGLDASYAWSAASVPAANLYGSDCTLAATHYAGPHWQANDGSIILGTKLRSAASASVASIPQLILSAVVDAGNTGIFTPVTAVQRLDTVGGIAPSAGCDVAHVDETVSVPYTATYYFYSGSNIIP